MRIACCIWALSESETDMLRQVRDIGFDTIDIQPMQQRSLESRLLAQELGLKVSCVGASFGMPAGAALDHAEPGCLQSAIDHAIAAIQHGADIGADTVYVIPGANDESTALERYRHSITQLADAAAEHEIKLAIEHFPGTALPTAQDTLAFIRQVDHDNLYLLYDSGHIQMSGEDPEAVISNAGDRLGYMHLDDNDGINDLHWSLLEGVMTDESLIATLRALDAFGYQGALSLELSRRCRTRPRRCVKAATFSCERSIRPGCDNGGIFQRLAINQRKRQSCTLHLRFAHPGKNSLPNFAKNIILCPVLKICGLHCSQDSYRPIHQAAAQQDSQAHRQLMIRRRMV